MKSVGSLSNEMAHNQYLVYLCVKMQVQMQNVSTVTLALHSKKFDILRPI